MSDEGGADIVYIWHSCQTRHARGRKNLKEIGHNMTMHTGQYIEMYFEIETCGLIYSGFFWRSTQYEQQLAVI